MLKKLENTMPFAKIAILGFAGDGKTYTASQIAIGIHKLIGSKKPIAVFDTEKALRSLKDVFKEANIDVLIDDENKSLAALSSVIEECEKGAADILIIDSITHVYEEFLTAYKNSKYKNKHMLEFQDWGIIKPRWKEGFSNRFVKSHLHIIFTGRAGFEYENEVNEETGKREIFKSGVKMKAENETAFEPDLLIDMQKVKVEKGINNRTLKRIATIIKDRTTVIDGMEFENPTFEDFKPCIIKLLDGKIVNENPVLIADRFDELNDKTALTKFKKEAAISNIEGVFNIMKLGTSAEHKSLKAAILRKLFNGVYSIDLLIQKSVEELENAFALIEIFSFKYIEYLEMCEASNTKVDVKEIGNILDKVITNKEEDILV